MTSCMLSWCILSFCFFTQWANKAVIYMLCDILKCSAVIHCLPFVNQIIKGKSKQFITGRNSVPHQSCIKILISLTKAFAEYTPTGWQQLIFQSASVLIDSVELLICHWPKYEMKLFYCTLHKGIEHQWKFKLQC